ncbi:cupin domain-containing protein [Embleya sp. AB8]|uniref:cupin domain-containing protein n=1 Tax=Embleya sp. AB8 TaxID=3156304 RepID=UPI003C709B4C
MNDQPNQTAPRSPTHVTTVGREQIRAVSTVEAGGETHHLGEQRDFRRNEDLAGFVPQQGRLSLAWVRLHDGERLDLHEHPTKSMILVCKGSVRLIGDREETLHEGDTVCVPVGSRHGFETVAGQDFHGLSVQFEGAGLYEDEAGPRVRFTEQAQASLAQLDELNQERLRRFSGHRFFKPFDDGSVGHDAALRARFVAVLYVWSVYFQRMLYARQALCTDPQLRETYAAHLREEFGHDVLLREHHGVNAEVYDPILEAVGNWYVMQMHGANEAAKIVIVHMVIETGCQVFGERTGPAFPVEAKADSYFDLHAAVDEDHRAIGRNYLRTRSPAEYPELMRVSEQAWDQFDLLFERIAAYMTN